MGMPIHVQIPRDYPWLTRLGGMEVHREDHVLAGRWVFMWCYHVRHRTPYLSRAGTGEASDDVAMHWQILDSAFVTRTCTMWQTRNQFAAKGINAAMFGPDRFREHMLLCIASVFDRVREQATGTALVAAPLTNSVDDDSILCAYDISKSRSGLIEIHD